ncbi:hypothetical protein ScPMuIL_013388 [Solemya velum]
MICLFIVVASLTVDITIGQSGEYSDIERINGTVDQTSRSEILQDSLDSHFSKLLFSKNKEQKFVTWYNFRIRLFIMRKLVRAKLFSQRTFSPSGVKVHTGHRALKQSRVRLQDLQYNVSLNKFINIPSSIKHKHFNSTWIFSDQPIYTFQGNRQKKTNNENYSKLENKRIRKRRILRGKRQSGENVYEYDYDYDYDYDYNEEEEVSNLEKLALNWQKVGLKYIFLGSFILTLALCCACSCWKCCVFVCRPFYNCFRGCYDRLLCRDREYLRIRSFAAYMGLDLDYKTYKKVENRIYRSFERPRHGNATKNAQITQIYI